MISQTIIYKYIYIYKYHGNIIYDIHILYIYKYIYINI